LLEFGITRVSDITYFDTIGIPIWKATRPGAEVLSVNGGKSLNPAMASAGATAEAIEFWAMEHPEGDNVVTTYANLVSDKVRVPHLAILPLAANSIFGPNIYCSWELGFNLFEHRKSYFLPSDCFWLKERIPVSSSPWVHFQSGSNGGAAGPTIDDALCTALYELIERDAWTLNDVTLAATGIYPPKVDLTDAPDQIADAVDRIQISGSRVFLFDISTDIHIRVFSAYLLDEKDPSTGIFGGFGASANPHEAALRAITESCQSRCCYLDGARDDLGRRSFYLLKHLDHLSTLKILDELPYRAQMKAYLPVAFDSVRQEINWIKTKLIERGLVNVYWKALWAGTVNGQDFVVVKAVSLDLEMPKCVLWRPRARTFERLKREKECSTNRSPSDE
jgi:YcaO-like protein with predicted kinase domain